jgi:hypothetical protein
MTIIPGMNLRILAAAAHAGTTRSARAANRTSMTGDLGMFS